MTDAMMDLCGLIEKSPDADILREMIGFACQRLMELEVGARTGTPYGEKSADRLVRRNGYRERVWETRAKIHSTNPIERLIGEIKRRTGVVGIFPNEDAIARLVGAILLEQNDEWRSSAAT